MSKTINNIRYNNRLIKYFKKMISSVLYLTGIILFIYKKKKFNIPREKVKKILFISLYFRGDVLFHTPVIRMMKLYFFNASIDVWVKSRSKEILENNPDVANIIVFDGVQTDLSNNDGNIKFKEKKEFYRKLKKENYDLVIDYTGLFSTGLAAHLLHPKYSAGKYEQRFGFFYNKFNDVDLSITKGNLIEKYQNIFKDSFDISEDDWEKLKASVPPVSILETTIESKEYIIQLLNERKYDPAKPLITLHMTAGWDAKRWDLKRFSELITELLKTNKFELAIIGNSFDRSEFQKISSDLKNYIAEDKLNVMFFELPLNVNAALIEKSDVFIGSDSVPLHIAGAVNTSSIGLFGPTNPDFSNPIGNNHHVIYYQLSCSADGNHQYCTLNAGRSCSTVDCMKLITVQNIINKIYEILSLNE